MRPIAVDGLKWSVSASVNNGYDRVGYPAKRLGKRGPRNGAWLMGRGFPSERADEGALSSEDKCHVRR